MEKEINISDIWHFTLRRGNSDNPRNGSCMLDAVSWFEYGTLGDHPECTCPIIAAFCRTANDNMTDIGRQKLKIFIPRLIGTRDKASEQARAEYLVWQAIRVFVPFWLDKAEMWNEAEELRNFVGDLTAARSLLKKVESNASTAAYTAYTAATAASAAAYATYAAYAATATTATTASTAAYAANASTAGAYAAYAATATTATTASTAGAYAANASTAWEPLLLAALDGVLAIGKQAEPIAPERIAEANEAFKKARELT